MKKVILSILTVVVVLAALFVCSVFYSKSQVDAFFNHDDGNIYNSSGIVWKLTNSQKGFFSAKYTTELSVYGKNLAKFEHDASFGIRGLNISKIGDIVSKFDIKDIPNMPSFLDKEPTIISSVHFGEIRTAIFKKAGNSSIDKKELDNYKNDDLSELYEVDGSINASWEDIEGAIVVTPSHDTFNFDISIPYFSLVYGSFSFTVENYKVSDRLSSKKVGFWLGESLAKVDKIEFVKEDNTLGDSGVTLSKLNLLMNTKDAPNSTLAVDLKTSLGNLVIQEYGDEKMVGDIVFNISLQNLDTDSMKKIYKSLSDFNPQDSAQTTLLLFSWSSYLPDILGKHPKIVLDELSLKYENKINKINGFAQYIGNADIKMLYNTWHKDFISKIDFDLDERVAEEEYLSDMVEEYIEAKDGRIKGSFEYKDGNIILNGKKIGF